MKLLHKYFHLVLVCFGIILIFSLVFPNVLSLQTLSGGDYTGLGQEREKSLYYSPFLAWQSYFNLGQSYVPFLNYAPYNAVIRLVSYIVPQTDLLERLVWWMPFFFIGGISIYLLYRQLYPVSKYALLAPVIFLFNSYALILLGGGQVSGIGLAYAFSPMLFYVFIRSFEQKRLGLLPTCLLALLFGVEGIFDVRILYVSLLALGIFGLYYGYFYNLFRSRSYYIRILMYIILPFFCLGLLHAYWLLPTFLYRQNPFSDLGPGYTTLDAVRFFSFAHFENTISLMHPNWPENVFGKIGFMRPEFLLLPILSFSSLFFLQRSNHADSWVRSKSHVLFWAGLALLGAFLSKGANDPLGGIYLWLFTHLPGFVLFRDPTKWYLWIALSYAVLLPFVADQLSEYFKTVSYFKKRQHAVLAEYVVVGFILCSFLFTIRSAFVGELGGMLQQKKVSATDYADLQTFLSTQRRFFRTLWVPTYQRFGYAEAFHPAVSAQDFFKTTKASELFRTLVKPESYTLVQQAAISYVIVPDDSLGEVFVKDRVYSESAYQQTVKLVTKIPWLHYVRNFGKIAVFAVNGTADHFFYSNVQAGPVTWRMISPVHYQILAEHGTIDGQLVFSEAYNPYWYAETKKGIFSSSMYHGRFNSFSLPAGLTEADIVFIPQRRVTVGMWISGMTSVMLLAAIAFLYRRRRYD